MGNRTIAALTLNRVIGILLVLLGSFSPTASATQIYALSADGTVRMLTEPDCTGTACDWVDIDRNRRTIALAATKNNLFQLHNNGTVWVWTGSACDNSGCPHWKLIDRNNGVVEIVANNNDLYQRRRDGSIWRWKHESCDKRKRCDVWERLDNNPAAAQITASGNQLFQRHKNGAIWRFTGRHCTGSSCPGWQKLDNNAATKKIAAAGPGNLYQLHNNGTIFRWKGQPCRAKSCPSWEALDRNPATKDIVASPGQLYQRHANGSIWRFKGAACRGNSCPSWERLDSNNRSRAIAAGTAAYRSDFESRGTQAAAPPLYQVHSNGSVWRWRGQPCNNRGCTSWANVTGGGAYTSYSRERGRLYVFDGAYYSKTVTNESETLGLSHFGYDTMRFARTEPRKVKINILILMASYSNTSFEPSQTKDYFRERFFGGRNTIENYFNANSLELQFEFNLAGIEQVFDRRTLQCAHRWRSCSESTDGAHYTMASVEQLEMLPPRTARRYRDYDLNNDGFIESNELFVIKIDGIPDKGVLHPTIDDKCGYLSGFPREANLKSTGKQIHGRFLAIGDETNIMTTVHEIAHRFGADDVYGSQFNSFGYTLMGPTCTNDESMYHLDPWHKMRMGMVKPIIIPIPRATTRKQEIRLTLPHNTTDYEPVLFYNPISPNEYFIMEYRKNGASSFDRSVVGDGLVIWHVMTELRTDRPSFKLVNYNNPLFGGWPTQAFEGLANAIVGAPSQTVGSGRPWRKSDGVIALNWPGRGRGDSGLRVRVKDKNNSFLTIEWWRN